MDQEELGWNAGVLGVLLALFASACASTPFRGPERGGASWLEARSDHFRLLTSQSESRARDALTELEETHAVFEQIAFPSTENPPGTTEIVVLPAEDFDALVSVGATQEWAAAYSQSGRYGMQSRMIVRGDLGDDAFRIFQHELTHRFVAFHFPNAPVWLNEGLATFWETLEIKGGIAYFGGELQTSVKPTPFRELIALRAGEFYSGDRTAVAENYVAASALIRVLYFQHRPVFNDYLNALKSGQRSEPQAWQHATSVELPQIESDLASFFSEHGTLGEIPARQVEARVDVAAVDESDVHVLWAGLLPWKPDTRAAVEEQLATALKLDPNSLDALAMQAMLALDTGKPDVARGALERALTLAPMRAKVLTTALQYSLITGHDLHVSKSQLARRLRRFQLTPPQLITLANYLSSNQQVDQAIELATRAVQLDSSCFDCYAVGSALLALRGDWKAAVAAYRTAVLLAGDGFNELERARLLQLEAEAVKHGAAN
jgi:tetratricopeptide (TPR) repeat protein